MADDATPKDDTLWCVNILGPDDVHACRDKADAVRYALYLNLSLLPLTVNPHPYSPVAQAIAVPWPHSPEGHAEDLARRDREDRHWTGDGMDALRAIASEVLLFPFGAAEGEGQ